MSAAPPPGDDRSVPVTIDADDAGACDAIIVNYSAGAALADAVGSLERCRQVRRIVVVDNASSDGSLAAVACRARVVALPQPENLGFARGCNRGLAATDAPFLLFLNPDCTLEPAAIAALLACLRSDPRHGMAG